MSRGSLLLETSLWRPAFIVAAACRDIEDRLGEVGGGGGESPAGFGWFGWSAMLGDAELLAMLKLKLLAGCTAGLLLQTG